MFKIREVKGHVFTIERSAHNGMYCVTLRSGVTLMAKCLFDTGRDAWRAFRSSPETFMSEAV